MIPAVRIWFAALTRREQWLVGLGGLLAAAMFIVYLIILPTLAAIDRARSGHDAAVERRGRIVAMAQVVQNGTGSKRAAAAADPDLLIMQSAAEKGFDLVKSPNATPGQITVRIEQARASALLSWLTELESENVVIRSLTLRSGNSGTVIVDAQLQVSPQ